MMMIKIHRRLYSTKPLKLIYSKYNAHIPNVPPLIILHGLMGSRHNWHTTALNLSKSLSPLRSIYIPDARNHGQSPGDPDISYEAMSEDLKLLIDTEIMVETVALMGHSMGGLTNILFALKWPEMVEKLIVIDVSPIMPKHETKLFRNIVNALKVMNSYPITKNTKSLTKERQKLYLFLKKEIPSKRTRQFLLKNLIRRNGNIKWQINIPALIENSQQFISFPNLIGEKTYEGPTCFISGEDSDFVRKSEYPEIKQLLPNAEFVSIENAGHLMHVEKPRQFIKIVSEKLNKC